MMNIFKFFGSKNVLDPYWEFKEEEHFRPRLNKGDYYKLKGFDFGWFVLKPLSKFVRSKEDEIEKSKSLSFAQKALYFWWYLDGQVTNGGFVQFYYNGYSQYVSTIIKGLEYVGDTEMANLIKKANRHYQKKIKVIEKIDDLFGSDLYDRLDNLAVFDEKYYQMNDNTMSLIENYFRQHPNEIGTDENGSEFDLEFSGICKTYHENEKIKDEFELYSGEIIGEFKSFTEEGNLKELIQYENGDQTGELIRYFENGNKEYQVIKDESKKTLIHFWFYKNGKQKKLESKLLESDKKIGEYKEWYENGQLSNSGKFTSENKRGGYWYEFYENGNKKTEAEYIEGKRKLINCWNQDGVLTMKDGTGKHIFQYTMFESNNHYEEEYLNYKQHGQQRVFKDGKLSLSQEMENGLENGVTKTFYKNGNLKEEMIYEKGRIISTTNHRKFKSPRVKTTIISRLCLRCYEDNKDYQLPTNEPSLLNAKRLESEFKADVSLFEPYGDDFEMGYSYTVNVDKTGKVVQFNFWAAANMWISKDVEANLMKLKFEPALWDDIPINSIHFIQHKFKLVDHNESP